MPKLDPSTLDPKPERSLDPETAAEWDALRASAHGLVDRLLDRAATVREGPCWVPPPPAALERMREAPAPEGVGLERALALAERHVLPYGTGNLHPRFWGWVIGGGNLPGLLGQWMSTFMNANVFAGNQGPVHLEQAVLGWFRRWLGFPEGASGLLTTGASMANLLGIAVAVHWATEGAAREDGPEALVGLRLYASAATHNSVVKAAQLLGLGSKAVRTVAAVDERIDMTALEAAVREDRARGLRPFCIVANVGTVGTGALDPLEELRAFADAERLWLHADGAIGAVAALSPVMRPRLGPLERVDSLAFDLHKWAQIPYDAGCLLVRDARLHRAAFAHGAAYLSSVDGGFSHAGAHAFNDYTPLLSRPDRALKVWMTFQALGTDRIAAVFEQNAAQAAYLAAMVDASPELERLAPVTLNIVCLRFVPREAEGPAGGNFDALNERILVGLQESGFCVLSPFRVGGRFCLRVCIANHRTRREDLDALLARVVEEGRAAARELRR